MAKEMMEFTKEFYHSSELLRLACSNKIGLLRGIFAQMVGSAKTKKQSQTLETARVFYLLFYLKIDCFASSLRIAKALYNEVAPTVVFWTVRGGGQMEITFIHYLIICPLVFLARLSRCNSWGWGPYISSGIFNYEVPVHMAIATNKLSAGMGTLLPPINLQEGLYP